MNAANLSRSRQSPGLPGQASGYQAAVPRLDTPVAPLVAQELWSDGDANQTLLQDLASRMPAYVAIHDVHGGASLQLLQMFAMNFFGRIQALQIRHRQTRNLLATIQYLDLDVDGSSPLRLIACDIDATLPQRQLLARSLLAFSTLSVLVVGDNATGGIASQLEAWRAQMSQEPWVNRHMLLMPLSSSAAAITRNAQMGRATPVSVRVTPAAVSPDDAWNYISGAWRRASTSIPFSDSGAGSGFIGLGEPIRAPRAQATHLAARPAAQEAGRELPAQTSPSPTGCASSIAAGASVAPDNAGTTLWRRSGFSSLPQPSPLKPMPTIGAGSPSVSIIQEHCERILQLEGVLAAAIFDTSTGLIAAQAGGAGFTEQLAKQGLMLVSTIQESARALGCAEGATDVTVQWADKNLILRQVPNMPHLAVSALSDRSRTNPVALRTEWLRVDALFVREPI
jgi:hypothetical protein